jgi:Nose resistant-to-fluoxetine protein, N-terminal domain
MRSSKFLLCFVSTVQCHELLLDFLNVQEDFPELDFNLTTKCANSLSSIRNGIAGNEVWAIKVLDASGKPRTGFVWGNNFWLGDERSCYQLNKPRKVSLVSSSRRRMHSHVPSIATKVPVEYRMFYASHTSPIQFDTDLFDYVGFHVGLCFPKSCQHDEINKMAEIVFQSKIFQNVEIYGNVSFTKTKTLKLRDGFFMEPNVRFLM